MTSELIAFIIALLCLLAVIMRIVHVWSFREQVEVLVHKAEFKQTDADKPVPVGRHYFCKVRNVGRRNVTLGYVVAECANGVQHAFTGQAPCIIKPGQTTEAWLALAALGTHVLFYSDIIAVTDRGRHSARLNPNVAKEGPVSFCV